MRQICTAAFWHKFFKSLERPLRIRVQGSYRFQYGQSYFESNVNIIITNLELSILTSKESKLATAIRIMKNLFCSHN